MLIKLSTISTRFSTEAPRSITIGQTPLSTSVNALNSPAGPEPTTITFDLDFLNTVISGYKSSSTLDAPLTILSVLRSTSTA